MSVVRIFFNPLDSGSKVEYPIEAGTQLIDFLQAEYPCGFDGVLRVFIGIEELAIENLDYVVQEDEQITMLVMPGITFAAIGTYLIQALIAFAIGYVINLIFQPDVPGSPSGGDESSVYSLSPTRNSARLGEPIEVIYGTVSYPPSFASVPYQFFSGDSNDQFVDELLCLGQGYFQNIEITVGDTPVGILAPGTVQFWIYGPDDHNSTAGVIEADIAGKVAGTSVPYPFWENCFTSPEVDNYEFSKEVTNTVETGSLAGDAYAQTTNVSGGVIAGRIEGVSSSLNIQVGDVLTLSGTTSNNKTITIASIIRSGATMTLYQKTTDAQQLANESPLSPTPVFNRSVQTDGQIAGPFRCQKIGQPINRVICDFVFPRGIYDVDGSDGDINQSYVTLEISVQQINETTDLPIGAPVVVEKTTYGRSTTPLRTSIDSGLLPEGAYEVTVTYKAGWGGERTTGEATLVGIRGIVVLDTTPGATYGPVTLMAIRMKATQGLAGAARSRIRVKATRVLDPMDPTVLGSNPMTAIKDVWTNAEYGLGRTLGELDPHITDIEAEWGLGFGPYVNGAFDQRGTGYEAMSRIAAAVAGKVVNNGGLTDVVLERSQSTRVALFNAATIVKDSLSITYNFDTNGDYDGIEAQYSDPDTFEARYAYYPDTPLPQYPDTYTLWGVTDSVYAGQMARYLQNVKANRRKLVRFETELDGWLVGFGDRIGVSFPLALWGESGVVVEVINPTTIRIDKNLDWFAGKVLMLRDDVGKQHGPYAVTAGAADNIVVFPSTPSVPIYDMDGREPTSYVYGFPESQIRDFVVSRISPKGGNRFEIEGQTYSEDIYTGAPPHMGPPTEPLTQGVYLSGNTAVGGYHDGQGLVQTTPDGMNILFNYKGDGSGDTSPQFMNLQHSVDGGVTFTPTSTLSNAGGGAHVVTCMQWDAAASRWWVCSYEGPDRQGKFYYKNGAGLGAFGFAFGSTDNYSHGFYARGSSLTQYDFFPQRVEFHTAAPSELPESLYDPDFATGSTSGWHVYNINEAESAQLVLMGGQGSNETTGILFGSNGPQEGPSIFVSHLRGATSGAGEAVFVIESASQNYIPIQVIYSDWEEGESIPTQQVDFGLSVGHGNIAYSGDLQGYVICAQDTTDKKLLHMRLVKFPSKVMTVSVLPSARMAGVMSTDFQRQLTWANGSVFYLAYIQAHDGGTYRALERILIQQPVVPKLWTPADLTTPAYLWFEANNVFGKLIPDQQFGPVDKWLNQSTGLRPVSSTSTARPSYVPNVINGKGVMRFNGTTHLLTYNSASPTLKNVANAMFFAVAKADTGNNGVIFAAQTTGTNLRFQVFKTNTGGRTLDGDAYQSVTALGNAAAQLWAVQCTVIDYSQGDMTIYDNGAQAAQNLTWQAPNTTSNSDSARFRIGAVSTTAPSNYFKGDIAEVILIQGDITTVTRQTIEGYLSHKYALQAMLPADHPYKGAPP